MIFRFADEGKAILDADEKENAENEQFLQVFKNTERQLTIYYISYLQSIFLGDCIE